jgi:hypothetical protein
MPPPGCPPSVRRLAEAALAAHAQRRCDEALSLLTAAGDAWELAAGEDAATGECGSGSGTSTRSGSSCSANRDRRLSRHRHKQQGDPQQQQESQRLAPAMALFLAMARSGVLMTAGRDPEAWAALSDAVPALDWLHEAGADAAAWHGAAGVVLYHLGELLVSVMSLLIAWCGFRAGIAIGVAGNRHKQQHLNPTVKSQPNTKPSRRLSTASAAS